MISIFLYFCMSNETLAMNLFFLVVCYLFFYLCSSFMNNQKNDTHQWCYASAKKKSYFQHNTVTSWGYWPKILMVKVDNIFCLVYIVFLSLMAGHHSSQHVGKQCCIYHILLHVRKYIFGFYMKTVCFLSSYFWLWTLESLIFDNLWK